MHTEVQRKEESDRTLLLLRAFPAAGRLQLNTHIVHGTDATAVWGSRYTHICIHATSNDGKYCSTVRHKTKPAVSPTRTFGIISPRSPTELIQPVKHLICFGELTDSMSADTDSPQALYCMTLCTQAVTVPVYHMWPACWTQCSTPDRKSLAIHHDTYCFNIMCTQRNVE
jgi:hypothetical protein